MKKENFSGATADALRVEVASLKKELFTLRLNASVMPVKDSSQFSKLRRRVARILTELRARSMSGF